MPAYTWYAQLIKPSWAPPSWLFGPVWTVLYILIAVSYTKIFLLAWNKQISWWVVLPFVLNLVFNFLFSPIQFGLKNNLLAAADILLVLATIVWGLVALYGASLHLNIERGIRINWVLYAQIPYLLWVLFATILQLTITYLNRHA
jgi:tryptophan-rich sensory protein